MSEKQRERAATQERDRAREVEAAGAERESPGDEPTGQASPRSPASPVTKAAKAQNPWRSVALGVALLAGVAGAAFFGMGAAQDSLTQQEVQQRQADYQASMAVGPIVVDRVSDDEVDDALATMGLDTEQKQELQEKVTQGRVELAWITIWDTHAEDGDIVRLESEGSPSVEVLARNAPTTVAFPMPASGVVNLTGMVDGGGGITIAAKSGAAQVAMPSMQPGQSLGIPVTVAP
jgi:hypothetical protein